MAQEPKQPKPIRGARTPLFERLLENDPAELTDPNALRVHGLPDLRESVRREVFRLLNTRSPVREDRNGTVIDYGIPDFSWMSAASGDDRRQLAEIIARKVAAFEPRLRRVHVELARDEANPRAVVGTLTAELVVETLHEPVSFPLAIQNKSGAVEVV